MPISDHRLERALSIAAQVVDLFGEKYWPIFERLESELEARRDRKARIRTYLPADHSHKQSSPRTVRRREPATGSRVIARPISGSETAQGQQAVHSDIAH